MVAGVSSFVRQVDVHELYDIRICPGRHFSENSLFSMVSMVLAVYDISPPVDAQGNQIKIKPEVIPGLAS